MRLAMTAVVVAVALAGCGGGDGGDTVVVPSTPPPPDLDGPDATFGQIRSDFSDTFALYDDPFPTTALAEMPVAGSATYTGSAVYSNLTTDPFAVRANPTRVSRVQMTADFFDKDVEGRLYSFRSADPATTIAGELAMTGIISGNTFQGGVFGAPGGVSGTLLIDGVAETHSGGFAGNFAGSDVRAINGAVVHSTPTTTYSGVMVGER
jgi:hypothetical protein